VLLTFLYVYTLYIPYIHGPVFIIIYTSNCFIEFYTIMYTVVRRGLATVFCSSQSMHLHPGVKPDESRFTPGDSEHQAEHLIVLTKCS
jgi:hypothetical protein